MTDTKKVEEIALRHGWEWFQYHAQQRLSIFRFYVFLVGALGTAYVAAMVGGFYIPAIAVTLVGCVLSFFFWLLDRRVSDLIKIGEAVLGREQDKLAERLGYEEIKIVGEADRHKRKYFYSYSQVFGAIFFGVFLMFFACAAYTFDQYVWSVSGVTLQFHDIEDEDPPATPFSAGYRPSPLVGDRI